ncbi:MAG: pro-sigmaK processing inhibitor BofA family protein [Clostridia bacterium]|nr:pro-sigmaK processing inhibitor BofA family protein [Clostridia bacterium]
MKAAVIIALAVSGLAVLISFIKSGHFFSALILSALQGLVALFSVDWIGGFIGVNISINPFTMALSALGGIPGVIFLLVSGIFFR